ncbi:MAG: hypothetical protein ACYCQI_09130 [Gammaproteobacteria bacterium]
MINKIIATALIAFASTGVMAKPEYKKMDLSQIKSGESTKWELGSPFKGMILVAWNHDRSFIFYVNKQTAAGLPSEPVVLSCNNHLTIVNPGTSAVCEIPMGESAVATIDQDYTRRTNNGAAGIIVDVEEKN